MKRILKNIKVALDVELETTLDELAPGWKDYRVLRQSIDARRRHDPHVVYSVEVFFEKQPPLVLNPPPTHTQTLSPVNHRQSQSRPTPVIIGAGPAGLFAALRLGEQGLPCLLLEQGSQAKERVKKINRFWRYGELDPLDNVCFGEGGAGLYSDGKLITRIKSPHIPYVLNRLVQFGAPEEILYLANPHVGSDRIRRIIPKLREEILRQGSEVRFNSEVKEILFNPSDGQVTGVLCATGEVIATDTVILACGHSAESIYTDLLRKSVNIEGKSFAVGFRIEHPQKLINSIQYRQFSDHPRLGPANYRLSQYDATTKYGVYSFCMCPGGYVLSCSTEPNQVVCNGMSNYRRNSKFGNAAIVVTVDYAKEFGLADIQAGLKFRKQLESRAYEMVQQAGGKSEMPAQRLQDFLAQKQPKKGALHSSSKGTGANSEMLNSCPSGTVASPLHELLPSNMQMALLEGLQKFDKSMGGFISEDAILFGVESRTSAPLRIIRDSQSLQSTSQPGLYPCGEGAGYAGGITSAACDGLKVADALLESRQMLQNSNPQI